jgi:hypothetical protein
MAYITVYSPDGQKYEVASRDRADKLLLEDGWTQQPPVDDKPKEKTKSRRKKAEPVEEVLDDNDVEDTFELWISSDAKASDDDS